MRELLVPSSFHTLISPCRLFRGFQFMNFLAKIRDGEVTLPEPAAAETAETLAETSAETSAETAAAGEGREGCRDIHGRAAKEGAENYCVWEERDG